MKLIAMDATKLAKIVFALVVAFMFTLLRSTGALGVGPTAIGSGECVQQGTGLSGSVVREDNYCLVALKSGSGKWVVPNGVKTIDFLIVGGGGGGGYSAQSGGGGAGSFYETTGVNVTAGTEITAAVGTGGAGGTGTSILVPGNPGGNGGTTEFNGLSAYGGGGGSSTGQSSGDSVNRAVSPGGSGGGDVSSPVGAKKVLSNSTTVVSDFSTAIDAGTAGVGQRNAGGRSKGVFQNFTGQNLAVSFWLGAGGGGAGAAGEDMVWISDGTFAGTGMRPGKGGIGLDSTLLNATSATALVIGAQKPTPDGNVYFAGGGGGYGNFDSTGWNGYLQFSPYGLNGGYAIGATGANSGDGGRGGGVKGADGVILIRYVIPQVISLGAEAISDTQVNLTWTAPSGTETITGYKVEKSLKGANSWSAATITPDVSSTPGNATTVSGLSPATEYDFRVTPKFASGDGVASPAETEKTLKAPQTVSWSPTNTAAAAGSDPITPDTVASTSGDGAITYSVQNAGTTSCTVDASTGELTFSTPGTCVVRATAAETATYESAYKDVSFTILTTSTAVTLDLQVATGAPVSGAEVEFTATGLSPETDWDLVVRSTPQTLGSGTVPAGGFVIDSATLPKDLEAGWHSLTWTGTGSEGNTVLTTLWFKVSKSGNLIETSSIEPTEDELDDSMPGTGANLAANVLWLSLGLVALGLLLIARVRGFKLSRLLR